MQSEIHDDDAIECYWDCHKVEVKDIRGGHEMPRDDQLGDENLSKN